MTPQQQEAIDALDAVRITRGQALDEREMVADPAIVLQKLRWALKRTSDLSADLAQRAEAAHEALALVS